MSFTNTVLFFLGLCLVVLGDNGFSVGDLCDQGVCMKIADCASAQQDKTKGIEPLVCGPNNSDVVCCRSDQSESPVLTTAKRPETTTEYMPTEPIYVDTDPKSADGCMPINPNLTLKPTGQKAFDKCLEYQDKYVYPCTVATTLLGGKVRDYNCHHNADSLIIAGTDAEFHEFPHMVLLGFLDTNVMNGKINYKCGGTLISEKFVLTAAHCSSDGRIENKVSHALIGILRRSEESSDNRYGIKRIIKHDNYHSPKKYDDIALLELDREVPLSNTIVPACLHTGDDTVDDSHASATGWGSTGNRKNKISETLQKVKLQKITEDECSVQFPINRNMMAGVKHNSQVCYGDAKMMSRDTCQGDSGGPLQVLNKKIKCMYTVVGVTSFGGECGSSETSAVFTRVKNYIPWIEGIVWPN